MQRRTPRRNATRAPSHVEFTKTVVDCISVMLKASRSPLNNFTCRNPIQTPVAANDEYILQILQENILVSDDQIEVARSAAHGRSTVDVLIEQGAVSQEDVARAIASNA